MQQRSSQSIVWLLCLLALLPAGGLAQPMAVTAVSHVGGGSREERGGWVCLHLKGSPTEIGREYGQMAAPEIDEAHRALRLLLKNDTGKDWDFYREAAQRLFW